MKMQGYYFKPRLWTIAVSIAFVVAFVQLGNWQLSRAEEKDARQLQLDQLSKQPLVSLPKSRVKLEDFLYREVEVRGEYLPEHTIYLDNRTYNGVAGYHILTPIRIADSSMHVLINRGWVATGSDRTNLPDIPEIKGDVRVVGIVVPPTQRALELSGQVVTGAVWATLYVDRYQEATGLSMQPILIQQQDAVEDRLIRQWDRPDSGSAKNMGYAFQWYAFAALTIIIFLVLNVKRNRSESTEGS